MKITLGAFPINEQMLIATPIRDLKWKLRGRKWSDLCKSYPRFTALPGIRQRLGL